MIGRANFKISRPYVYERELLQPSLFELEHDRAQRPELPNSAGSQELIQHPLRIRSAQLEKLPASRPLVPHLKDRKHPGEQPFKRDLEAMGQ